MFCSDITDFLGIGKFFCERKKVHKEKTTDVHLIWKKSVWVRSTLNMNQWEFLRFRGHSLNCSLYSNNDFFSVVLYRLDFSELLNLRDSLWFKFRVREKRVHNSFTGIVSKLDLRITISNERDWWELFTLMFQIWLLSDPIDWWLFGLLISRSWNRTKIRQLYK